MVRPSCGSRFGPTTMSATRKMTMSSAGPMLNMRVGLRILPPGSRFRTPDGLALLRELLGPLLGPEGLPLEGLQRRLDLLAELHDGSAQPFHLPEQADDDREEPHGAGDADGEPHDLGRGHALSISRECAGGGLGRRF